MAKRILKNGYRTTFAFDIAPNIKIAQKTVKLPGFDMGGGIDTTTMDNNEYRTMAAKALATLTNGSIKVAYDADCYADIMIAKGKNGRIIAKLPSINGATPGELHFYGFIDKFEPSANQEGNQPEADMTIVVTNEDYNGDESIPTYVVQGAAGTTTTPAPVTTTTAAPVP